MSEGFPRSLALVWRMLRRRSAALARGRAEHGLRPRLRHDPAAPELLLSPHWDDAVLDCWGVLSSPRELTVVNLFAGVPAPGKVTAWEGIIGVKDTAERARARIAEDERALALARRQARNLPLPDARSRKAPVALGELDGLLAGEVPAASRVYAPAGIGGHADHLLARRYAQLLRAEGMPVSLYAELPYCVFHGWPAWVDGSAADPRRNVDAYWASFVDGVPGMPDLREAAVERLDGSSAQLKRQALQLYQASLNHAIRTLLSDPQILGFEVRWALSDGRR
jgi:hypothetical protein